MPHQEVHDDLRAAQRSRVGQGVVSTAGQGRVSGEGMSGLRKLCCTKKSTMS